MKYATPPSESWRYCRQRHCGRSTERKAKSVTGATRKQHRPGTRSKEVSCTEPAPALGEQGIVNNEFPLQNLVIAQAKRAEPMSNPA